MTDKITEDDVLNILGRYERGRRSRFIARKLGISSKRVGYLCSKCPKIRKVSEEGTDRCTWAVNLRMEDLMWDPKADRFRNLKNGRFVSRRQVDYALHGENPKVKK